MLMEYLRMHGRIRSVVLQKLFGTSITTTLRRLETSSFVKKTCDPKKKIYYELGAGAYRFLRNVKTDSFVRNNPYYEKQKKKYGWD